MPVFDQSGPVGASPMTGGRRGLCNPVKMRYGSEFAGIFGFGQGMGLGYGFRRGFGRSRGRTFGRRFWNLPPYYPAYPQNSEKELHMLKAEANSLKNSLEMINRRIVELEKPPE